MENTKKITPIKFGEIQIVYKRIEIAFINEKSWHWNAMIGEKRVKFGPITPEKLTIAIDNEYFMDSIVKAIIDSKVALIDTPSILGDQESQALVLSIGTKIGYNYIQFVPDETGDWEGFITNCENSYYPIKITANSIISPERLVADMANNQKELWHLNFLLKKDIRERNSNEYTLDYTGYAKNKAA